MKSAIKISPWIEAMRLRTLPVSCAGVIAGGACSLAVDFLRIVPFLIALTFAVLAQIASNFANEYFDFRNGLDKKGRAGFRRGVTEGDISPKAMLRATIFTTVLASLIGLSLLFYGAWWLILIGVAVVIFLFAYSTGPYPLSHHGLGDLAVLIFFGIVPVNLTAILTCNNNDIWILSLPMSIGIGLMAVNVLIVNNYRDMDEDRKVNKFTTVVLFGREFISKIYLANGFIAMIMIEFSFILFYKLTNYINLNILILQQFILLVYANIHFLLSRKLNISEGSALNPLLANTAKLMFLLSLAIFIISIF